VTPPDGSGAAPPAAKASDAGQRRVQAVLMATMLVWGVNVPLVKALTTWFDASSIAVLRMLVASATFGGLLLWRHGRLPAFSRNQWAGLLLCAFTMVYLNQIAFAAGLVRTPATNAALILATAPMVSGLLAALVFGERLSRRRLVGLGMGFAGVAVVVLQRTGAALAGSGPGDLMVIGSVFAFASGGVMVQRLSRGVDALALSTVIYGAGTVMLVLHALALGGGTLSRQPLFPGWWPWLLIVFSGVCATALGNWVWNGAIARIGVARTAVYIYWVPVFGMGFSALLLGEPLNAWYGLGLALVLGGSALGTRRTAG
jgi:drug/metabolite transporter (DMT)-like permease